MSDEYSLIPPSGLDINPMKLFDIAKAEGRPVYCAAPMVRYSKLAFRNTVAKYGVDLVWTPMILAKEFNRSVLARDSDFTLSPTFSTKPSTPTIAQLGVSSPAEISRTTTLLAPHISGIDINCGCPQSWACQISLGAALMTQPSLVASMVTASKSALQSLGLEDKKTVSVKIRIHKDLRQTVDFVRIVEDAGVDFITVHGRTKGMKSSEPVNVEAIKLVKSVARVPVIANGDIFTLQDTTDMVQKTGVDGVMAARGLLENPGLFHTFPSSSPFSTQPQNTNNTAHPENKQEEKDGCHWEVLETFLNEVIRAPIPFKLVVHHLSEMGGSDRGQKGTLFTKEQRRELMECRSMIEVLDWVDEVGSVRRL